MPLYPLPPIPPIPYSIFHIPGLLRTEEMFLGPDRIGHFRVAILSDNKAARQASLDALLPLQMQDFVGIFRAMGHRQVLCLMLGAWRPVHYSVPLAWCSIVHICHVQCTAYVCALALSCPLSIRTY
jgi:hypothetical protein